MKSNLLGDLTNPLLSLMHPRNLWVHLAQFRQAFRQDHLYSDNLPSNFGSPATLAQQGKAK